MLTNDQLKRLQEAGCPGIREGETFSMTKPLITFTSPTVEEMMGWMQGGLKIFDEHAEIWLVDRYDGFLAHASYWSGDKEQYIVNDDVFPDALSALYDLWERLEEAK